MSSFDIQLRELGYKFDLRQYQKLTDYYSPDPKYSDENRKTYNPNRGTYGKLVKYCDKNNGIIVLSPCIRNENSFALKQQVCIVDVYVLK